LTVVNHDAQSAAGVILSESVPVNTTFVGSTSDWSCAVGAAAGAICQHMVGNLASNATAAVPFIVKVNQLLPAGVAQLSNVAHVSDSTTTNIDTSSDTTLVAAAPDLNLTQDDGGVSAKPGDTIVYTLLYANRGNQAATGVTIRETVPANTVFAPSASTPGWDCVDRTCTYPVGALAGGATDATGTIAFAVQVNTLVPIGVSQVTNVATIDDDGNNGNDLSPADNTATDATPLIVAFALTATKQDILAIDADGNQVVSPGDTLEYLVTIHNAGNSAVSNVNFQDPLDIHTNLIAETPIQTSQGNVISGTNPSERIVQVAVGTMAADVDVQIRFRVKINNALPGGVSEIVNQGVVKSDELADVLTDDPNVSGSEDATHTALITALALHATLTDYLFADVDNDNKVSGGDLLLYRLTVANVGNIGATDLFIDDAPDAHSLLVAGTVRTDRGVIVTGNLPGDTRVRIHLNAGLQSGERATISFQVKIAQAITVAQLVNQAQLTIPQAGSQATVLSDDPDTAQIEDATVTPIGSQLSAPTNLIYLPLINKR
jgi:uncharacterized repeat protein (TIGR01451 family)